MAGRFTKNRTAGNLPLHPELVAELRKIRSTHENPTGPVLTGAMLPSMDRMKGHMTRAEIPIKNEYGKADFHSCRHWFATSLVRANVAPRVAQELMRHSDIRLTMNIYADPSGLPLAQAINALPALAAAKSAQEILAGDGAGSQKILGELTQIRTQKSGTLSHGETLWS